MTMKLGSLFDGSGGFPLAGSLCGIEPVWASEVEPYPIAVTRSRFPNMRHLGDISKVHGGEIEPVDIITFGSPCFPAGTLVLTDKGYTPIEELRCGDIVFTHNGNWKPISAIGYKKSPTVIMKGNHYGIVATPNHPFYSAEQSQQWNGNGYTRTLEKIGEWTKAEEMQGKRWAVPNSIHGISIPNIKQTSAKQNTPPVIDVHLMYIIGRYLGDGWLRNGQRPNRSEGQTWGQIFICANAEKADYLERRMHDVFDGVSAISRISERTVEKFRVSNQALCEWIEEHFGCKADGKRIPSFAYCMSPKMRESLLQGLLDSDGYHFKENTWKVTTVSKKLAHGVRLLAETLGYSCTVHYADVGSKTTIEGRTVNQKPQYQVVMGKEERSTSIKHGTHNWYKCRSVEPYSNEQTVYNITVDDDHSYVVEGVVVHNCQDLSVAGKRAGLKHEANGDEETTRSGLFMEAVRIIKEMRKATNGMYPTFALWENVPGAFSSNGGEDFRIVCEELIKIVEPSAVMPAVPEKGWAYADSYVGDGWSLAYRVFDAQYWGVPQRRRRIHLVVDFRGERAREILFEREGVRGYFAPCRTTGQGTSHDAERGSGADDQERKGFDGYNGDLTGDVSSTIGVNCGMSTGRNGVIECRKVYAIDHVITTGGNCTAQGPCYYEGIMPTLKASGVHGVCIPIHDQATRFSGKRGDKSDGKGNGLGVGQEGDPMNTLTSGDHHAVAYCTDEGESRANELVVETQPTYCLQGSMIGRTDKNGPQGDGVNEDVSFTCNTTDRHAVAYCTDVGFFNSLENQSPTLLARSYKDPHLVAFAANQRDEVRDIGDKATALQAQPGMKQQTFVCQPPQYIVRRLIPTECARLQGFADWWAYIEPKTALTEEEYNFWLEVRSTHAAINGKKVQEYTKPQMLTWYNKLHTDSAEYKMWGNGIALPPALYVMQGIADALYHALVRANLPEHCLSKPNRTEF